MSHFLDSAWMLEYQQVLNSDLTWVSAATFFSAAVGFKSTTAFGVIDISNGKVVYAQSLVHPIDADVVIVGLENEWQRLVSGEPDWFRATSPGFGTLTIEGNAVTAMQSIKVMWLSLAAMSRINSSIAKEAIEYSPEPRASGAAIKGQYIQVDGIPTYYEEAGSGYPILCFHAACQDTLMYRHLLDALSDEYRVIAVDAPGHGKSMYPENGPFTNLTQHAEFNEKFIQKLGLVKPAILGCSMGGNMVLEIGSRNIDGYAAVISSEGADYTPTLSSFLLDMLMINGQQILEGYAQSLTGSRTPPDRAREVVW